MGARDLSTRIKAWLLLVVLVLSGCSVGPKKISSSAPKSGGYYENDGPPDASVTTTLVTEDAVPRVEPLRVAANRPYAVFGKTYQPMTALAAFTETGFASWYGKQFHGRKTSTGEVFDMMAMTAAHPTLPLPSYVRVTNLSNGRQVVVRVNDRGPFLQNRIIDLSYAAAHKLGYVGAGHTRVRIELILPAEFQDPVVGHKQEPDELAQLLNQVTSSASATAVAVTPASPGSGVPSLGASVHSTGVFLQLGAFSSQDNAQASVQKMVRLFPALEGLIKHDAQGGLFRVRAGPYASIESANLQAENIFAVTGLRPLRVTEKLNH
jgi:rare lipoprotein A